MSDPMTNMEIEDVLSSIRRLVSEDLRPAPRDSAPSAPRPLEPEGKLVLTPAFRVTEPALVKSDEAPVWRRAASRYRSESAETDDLMAEADNEDGATDADDPAEELPSDLVADNYELTGSERTDDDLQDLSAPYQDEGAVPAETVWVEQQAILEPDPSGSRADLTDQPAPDTTTDAATLEAAIAELEAAVAASGEEWEPDGSEMTSGDHFILPPMGAGRVMAEAAEAFGLRYSSEEQSLRRLHLEPGTYQDDPAEPVWAEPGASAGMRMLPGRGDSGVVKGSLAETDQADASMFASDDTLMDEGMLRELVIEVIRQELQGALGERITRNVRKLVRAEIHRALAGREFE